MLCATRPARGRASGHLCEDCNVKPALWGLPLSDEHAQRRAVLPFHPTLFSIHVENPYESWSTASYNDTAALV